MRDAERRCILTSLWVDKDGNRGIARSRVSEKGQRENDQRDVHATSSRGGRGDSRVVGVAGLGAGIERAGSRGRNSGTAADAREGQRDRPSFYGEYALC